MYIMNGICYAEENGNQSEIIEVKVLDDMILLLTFKMEKNVCLMRMN